MALTNAFLDAKVMHARHAPKKHVLNYSVWYLCINLSDLTALGKLKLFGLNSHNVYSLFDRDYGAGQGIDNYIATIKDTYGLTKADGETTLVTMPRTLFYGFNPVSFWFMKDKEGGLRAVLAEVNNTFGERHSYLCRHPDGRVIIDSEWLHADKVFHVSPFLSVSGTYDFRFRVTEEDVAVWINHNDNGQRMLTTSLIGVRQTLSNSKLSGAFWRYPLLTLKVIGLIHWHALRLVLKGIRYNRKPQPPEQVITS